LLAFVDVDLEEDKFFFVVEVSLRHGSEVDITLLAIGLAQVFQPLGDFILAENISIPDGEEVAAEPLRSRPLYCF